VQELLALNVNVVPLKLTVPLPLVTLDILWRLQLLLALHVVLCALYAHQQLFVLNVQQEIIT
jgi:type III secretory pathway component EscV